MGIFDDANKLVVSYLEDEYNDFYDKAEYVQYHHEILALGVKNHCIDCIDEDKRIYENDGTQPPIEEEKHPNCHCYYRDIETKPVGSISKKGDEAPDVYLKLFGHLPSYYITKDEARKLGWKPNKGNLNMVAPGKMIGGDIFLNIGFTLPLKKGRTWYECDVDYFEGFRNGKRLIYSSDGLMFLTNSHYNDYVYIK